MALAANFIVKKIADLEVGELVRFRIGGAVRTGILVRRDQDGSLDFIILQGLDRPTIAITKLVDPVVSFGTNWTIEASADHQSWVGNNEFSHVVGCVYIHEGGGLLLVDDHRVMDGNRFFDIETCQPHKGDAPARAAVCHWKLWKDAATMNKVGAEPIIDFHAVIAADEDDDAQ